MSITLLVAPGESQAERLQSAIRDAGSEMSRNGTRPHISLAVFDALDPNEFAVVLKTAEIRTSTFELKFDSVGVFRGEKSVIYLNPEPSEALLALHRAVHAALGPTARKCREHYHPDFWRPHLTIAFPVANSEVAGVEAMIAQRRLLGSYRFDRVQVVSSPPWTVEKSVTLTSAV